MQNGKKHRLNLVFFTILISIMGCNSLKETTIYKSHNKGMGSTQTLILHDNERFEYRHTVGLINSKSEGVWKIDDHIITLKSDSVYKNGFIETIMTDNSTLDDSIEVKIVFKDGDDPIETALFSFDSSGTYYVTNKEGIAKVPYKNWHTLVVSYLGDDYKSSFLKQEKRNIKVSLVESVLAKTYFDNVKWTKNGSKLTNPDGRIFTLRRKE